MSPDRIDRIAQRRSRVRRAGAFFINRGCDIPIVLALVAGVTMGVTFYKEPEKSDKSQASKPETIPLLRPSESPTPIPLNLRSVLQRNIYPGSPLLDVLGDMHFEDGLDVEFGDCTDKGRTTRIEHVESTVIQRKAPSQLRGEKIVELHPSETPISSPIEATVKWAYKEPLVKKWSAQLIGEGLGFIAQEQSYRQGLLKRFLQGTDVTCEPLPFDYKSMIGKPSEKAK